jgi:RNA 2',3'-cyclic 3'-phosphodiesterase
MSDERWRCFVAVPLGEPLRRELAAAVDDWRRRPDLAGLRWTDPGSWHVTLAFLGSIEASSITNHVADLADAVDRHAPACLETAGVGGFPSAARARVAWYGVADLDGALAALAADVRRAAGVESSEFRGHVTLARTRRDPVDLRAWVRDAEAPAGELAVDRVELMRSHLGRRPARYEVVESFSLGDAARV